MRLTLYVRTYPVEGAPGALSFSPTPPHQRHTFTREGKVYEAVGREVSVVVPDGSEFDADRRLLCWHGGKGKVKSTVDEVYALVKARDSGFRAAP